MKFHEVELSLNPDCCKPGMVEKKLDDEWYVYFYYYHNGKRQTYITGRMGCIGQWLHILPIRVCFYRTYVLIN